MYYNWHGGCRYIFSVCVPFAVESRYQNLSIVLIGANTPKDHLQETIIHEKNKNEEEDTVGVLGDASGPVTVENFRPDSVDDVKLDISEVNCEITVTHNSLYYMGAGVFTNFQLQNDVPMRNFGQIIKSEWGDFILLGDISAIMYAMTIIKDQSRLKKKRGKIIPTTHCTSNNVCER